MHEEAIAIRVVRSGRGVLVISYQRVVKIGRGTTKVLKLQTEMVA